MASITSVLTFIGICLTALALGAIAFLTKTLDLGFSAFASLLTFTVLMLWQMSNVFRNSHAAVRHDLTTITRGLMSLNADLADLKDDVQAHKSATQRSYDAFGKTVAHEVEQIQKRVSSLETPVAQIPLRFEALEKTHKDVEAQLETLKTQAKAIANAITEQPSLKQKVQALRLHAEAPPQERVALQNKARSRGQRGAQLPVGLAHPQAVGLAHPQAVGQQGTLASRVDTPLGSQAHASLARAALVDEPFLLTEDLAEDSFGLFVPERFQHFSTQQFSAEMISALEEGRHLLHVQPIVRLPERRTQGYEAFSRLQLKNGALVMPHEFLPFLETMGKIPDLDFSALSQGVNLLRKIHARSPQTLLFLNISLSTLGDPLLFPEVLSLLEDKTLARQLCVELTQASFLDLDSVERENLNSLSRLGVRLVIDQVETYDLPFDVYAQNGVRFVKISPDLLTAPDAQRYFEIALHDLNAFAGRYGIELIAEHVESEKTIAHLAPFEIRYGQGHAFGAARAIHLKPEAQNESTPKRRGSAA